MLAPSELHFYDREWRFAGSKKERKADIREATGIARKYLKGEAYKVACVAVKMSWMAHRYTSRVEDMAYALLGILGVRMKPSYGDGAIEFTRMQECLIQQGCKDESVFAWTNPSPHLERTVTSETAEGQKPEMDRYGLLAPWPSCFIGASKVKTIKDSEKNRIDRAVEYSIDKSSTVFPLAAVRREDSQGGTNWNDKRANERTRFDLSLNCCVEGYENDGHITIRLLRDTPTSPWTCEVTDGFIVAMCTRKSTTNFPGLPRAKVREARIPHVPFEAGDWGDELARWLPKMKENEVVNVQKRRFKSERDDVSIEASHTPSGFSLKSLRFKRASK